MLNKDSFIVALEFIGLVAGALLLTTLLETSIRPNENHTSARIERAERNREHRPNSAPAASSPFGVFE